MTSAIFNLTEEMMRRSDSIPEAQQFYIITTRHAALWPGGVLLFWGPDRRGYSAFLERAGKYQKEEALKICGIRNQYTSEFMVPCEELESKAIRVVDFDLLNEFKTRSKDFISYV